MMTNLAIKLFVGAMTALTMFTVPSVSAPTAGPKGILAAPVDNSEFVKVRAARGGYRGGAVHRGAAVPPRAAVYRAGAEGRRGAAVGGRPYGGRCLSAPYFQKFWGGPSSGREFP